ncbi:MAG TPA: hypothetical protein PJ991_01400 [Kiritimatiellia bacterium]|nr:hypothetical protein [Kiritimatiellia bacterium]
MKKTLIMTLGLLGMVAVPETFARGRDFTLIVAPSRFSVMQVMFDVIDKRPSVLISYQGDATTLNPLIHGWDGNSWVQLGMHDLRELSFLKKSPTRAVLIGGDDLLPASIREALAWVPELVYIRQLDNANLVNEFGRIFKWNRNEWRWFSKRYNLTLEDEAAPLRRSSWYDQTGPLRGGDASIYQPAPVRTTRESLNPSSTTLPPVAPVERPSDLYPTVRTTTPASSEEIINDLDNLVESLEKSTAVKPDDAVESEAHPIK